MTDTIPRKKQKVNILVGRHYFEILHWPDAHGNEDRKGLLTMHTIPPKRRLAQFRLSGVVLKKSQCSISTTVQYTSLPCWRCQFDSDMLLKLVNRHALFGVA